MAVQCQSTTMLHCDSTLLKEPGWETIRWGVYIFDDVQYLVSGSDIEFSC
jgi:hypothetical protein